MSADTLTPDGSPQSVGIHSTVEPIAATGAGPDVVVLENRGGPNYQDQLVTGYTPQGEMLFNTSSDISGPYPSQYGFQLSGASIAGSSSGVMVVLNTNGGPGDQQTYFETVDLTGAASALQTVSAATDTFGGVAFTGASSYHLEWLSGNPSAPTLWQENVSLSGAPMPGTLVQSQASAPIPYAGTMLGGTAFTVEDNQAQLSGAAPATLPNEPAHAVTDLAVAAVAGGAEAAVAWIDSGAEHLSIYDASTNSFGPNLTLDWGGATHTQVVALPDGGFAVSWMNGGAYYGEIFDAAGNGGGKISLAGQAAGIDNGGELFTVAPGAGGEYTVQSYAISGSGGGTGGTTAGDFALSGPASISNGASGVTHVDYTVQRGGDTGAAGAVDWFIWTDGNASSADSSDFSGATAGTLYFQAGQSTGVIELSVNGDPTPENNETFHLTLSNGRGGTIDPNAGSVTSTIVDSAGSGSGGSGGSTGGAGGSGSSSSVDTLTPNHAPVVLMGPPPNSNGLAYQPKAYAPLVGSDAIVVAYAAGQDGVAEGYSLGGGSLYTAQLASDAPVYGLMASSDATGKAVVTSDFTMEGGYQAYYSVFGPAGQVGNGQIVNAHPPVPYTTWDGFRLQWDASTGGYASPYSYTYNYADYDASGRQETSYASPVQSAQPNIPPYAATAIGSNSHLEIVDNQVQYVTSSGSQSSTVPGEPAAAITQETAVGLASGTTAAIGWVDSGTAYISVFTGSTNSFGPQATLDWGGASDLHLVALPDGDFVASWMKDGAYKGEVFSANGSGGGILSLDGDVADVSTNGQLYTVGMNPGGQYEIQSYTITPGASGGGGSGSGGSTVSTSASWYAAPDGVTTIYLTGNGQTIFANNAGDTIYSDDNGPNHITGGTGADTIHVGRSGDVVTGAGGADDFVYDQTPWGGSTITDFTPGTDTIDITGLLAASHYTGTDAVADSYIKITSDASGNAQVWSDMNQPGNTGWWLVSTLDGVQASSIHLHGAFITG